MAGSAFLGSAILIVLGGTAGGAPAQKPFQKRLKVASIDPGTRTISVREPDLEVIWNEETRFLHHRSLRLRDLKRGTALHVLGRLHSVRSTTTSQSDSSITDLAFVGMGNAYEPPPLIPQNSFFQWHVGTIVPVGQLLHLRVGDALHRLAVGADASVYSLDKVLPAELLGKFIIVRGEAAPARGDTKQSHPTRILATEVHLVELNVEHTKVFQLQWGEARKSPMGLRGEYFDNSNFTDLKVSRIDLSVNFDWGTGSPDPSMDIDTFSVRWTGQITPPSTGSFTFQVSTDDGVRLWVDNQLLIDNWKGPTESTESISLVAGKKYDIRMEYFEGIKTAFARLSWSGPSLPREIIPPTYLSPAPATPPPAPVGPR